MKNLKTKNFVAFAATCVIGAVAITGVAFGANALLKNNVYPHADAIVEPTDDEGEELTQLTVGSNSLELLADENLYAVVACSGNPIEEVDEEGNVIVTEHAQPGNYTFSSTSRTAYDLTCTVDGEEVTYTLGSRYDSVTIYLEHPISTVLIFSASRDLTADLNISYAAVIPDINISDDTLVVGNNQVTADWFGVYYTFTAEVGGTYVLNCTDTNAFIMVETEYGEDQILWQWVEVEEDVFEEQYVPYEFTLAAGESHTFLMAANIDGDDMDATVNYIVNIALKAD